MREMLADLQRRGLIQQRSPATSGEECLVEIEERGASRRGDFEWLIDRVRALTAERDALTARLESAEGFYRAASEQRDAAMSDRAQALAERDDLIVERDKWKTTAVTMAEPRERDKWKTRVLGFGNTPSC